MQVESSSIPGLLEIFPKRHGDSRGFFSETWQCERYSEYGMPLPFAQDNVSRSTEGILRGLHHQSKRTQGKLIYVLAGEITDVVVDLRTGSPTFGHSKIFQLSADTLNQVYVPRGMAHGFVVRSSEAIVTYKCTDYYHPDSEITLKWDDQDLNINWQIQSPILSSKDQEGLAFKHIDHKLLFKFNAHATY